MPGATWPMFEKCFCFFEQEGVLYDFRVIKIMKRNKKIFDLSYWTGLYDQNCRNYHPFHIVGHTGPMVTWYTGGLSQLPVVKMSWEKNLRKNLWFRTTFVFYSILKSQVLIMTWSQGHLEHKRHISASSGQNELGKRIWEKTWGPEHLLFSIQFWNLKYWLTLWHQFAAVSNQ